MPNEPKFTENELLLISKAEQYCATGEQCRSAVRDKLYAWGANREQVERVVNHLVANDFINEARYCRIYCESKLHLQKWGRIKMSYQLRLKRIDNSVIEEALNNIDAEQYSEALQQLAQTKLRSLNEPDPRKRDAKLMSYLASHGFESDLICNVINNLKETEI